MHQDPGKAAVTPQKFEPYLPASIGEYPVEVSVSSDLLWGWGHWKQKSWKGPIGESPLGGYCYPYHRAHRPQGWVTSD